MPDRKLLLWEHVNCLINCCKWTTMRCLILVILLHYVLCIWILLWFLVIPKVVTILHFYRAPLTDGSRQIRSRRWLPRPKLLSGLLGFYKSPDIMALRMPDRKLIFYKHVNCLVKCCEWTLMGCLILVIVLRYVLCIWILLCFLVIPKVLTILHFMICLPQSFPRVRHWNNSLEASTHSRLSDHMMYFRDYVP